MGNKLDVKTKASAFFEVVFRKAQAHLGESLTTIQEGTWWTNTNPMGTSMSSGNYQREVIDSVGVSNFYQTQLMGTEFSEQTDLYESVAAAGIPRQSITPRFLLHLVFAFCDLRQPFNPTQASVQALLDEFACAVIDNLSTTKYQDAMVHIDLGGESLILEDGVLIRPVTEEDLWDLSQPKFPLPPYEIQFAPDYNWAILEIRYSHPTHEEGRIAGTIYSIRESIIAGLAITVGGDFVVLPIGMETKFGASFPGGRSIHGETMPREFGRPFQGLKTTLSPEVRQEFTNLWPQIKEIMTELDSDFGLPVRRLVDGLSRRRPVDAIIDYSIGLEALLLNVRDELSYRFSLRGALILASVRGDKKRRFEELRVFYQARSRIIHGQDISGLNLHALRSQGEQSLREILTWFLKQGLSRDDAIINVDDGILS